MSNSLNRGNSISNGPTRKKNASSVATQCPTEWVYKAEYRSAQICGNKDKTLSNNLSPRRSLDGNCFKPKAEEQRHCSDACSYGNLMEEMDSGIAKQIDDVFELPSGKRPSIGNSAQKRLHAKDGHKMAEETKWMETSVLTDLNKNHSSMLEVLNSRKLALDAIRMKLKHEGYDGLIMALITVKEDSLTADLLPFITHSLQKNKHVLSPMMSLVLVPSILSLLNSDYDEYLSKAMDFIEVYLSEVPPTNCQFYHSCIHELHELVVSLTANQEKLHRLSEETCFKIQNCLECLQLLKSRTK